MAIPRIFWRYKRGKLNAHNYSDILDEMVGIPEKLLDDVAQKCFRKKLKKDIYPEIKKIIQEYHQKKIPVILATSSPEFIIRPLAEYLNADLLIATEIEFEDGYTNGRFHGEPCFREVKLKRIEQLMTDRNYLPENCTFYSDSIHDLSTLEYIGHPVAVNPDFLLRNIALEREWKVLRPQLRKK